MLHVLGGKPLYLFESLLVFRSEIEIEDQLPRQFTENMVGYVLAQKIRFWNHFPVSATSSSSLQGLKCVVREFSEISA
jgi:hypothetical protein